jgi:N-acetyl-1-D-myo-inositol-2-amino-2-deoxy-alpha-D-glucopyranoside deacetylase
MQWGANGAEPVTDVAPAALTSAEFGEVGADIAAVIAELGPDAVVSYDEHGGYGHPDHVRTAAAARRAAEYLGVPYWSVVVGDATADREVDVTPVLARKRGALLEYRSQLTVGPDWSAGANGEREPIAAVERFRRELPPAEQDTTYATQSLPLKIFTLAVSALLGAATGALFTAAHQSSLLITILGVLAVAALLAGLRTAFRSRLVAAIAAGGLAVGDLVLRFGSASSAELDRQNLQGIVWIWVPFLVAVLVVVLPGWGRRRRR